MFLLINEINMSLIENLPNKELNYTLNHSKIFAILQTSLDLATMENYLLGPM